MEGELFSGEQKLVDENLPPAFYAKKSSHWTTDFINLLHTPYTAWHLSYVIIGACLSSIIHINRLVILFLAFFFGLGICAHALDELKGHPLKTSLSDKSLKLISIASILIAVGLGILEIKKVGLGLVIFIVIGIFLTFAYNLELFNGYFHTEIAFGLAWGAFPIVTSFYVQTHTLSVGMIVVAIAITIFSIIQRRLSTPARFIRRKITTIRISGKNDLGEDIYLNQNFFLEPLESALNLASWSFVILSLGLLILKINTSYL